MISILTIGGAWFAASIAFAFFFGAFCSVGRGEQPKHSGMV